MSKEILKNHCYICKNDMKYILEGIDLQYTSTLKKFDIYKCINCWLEQVYPLITQEDLLGYYPQNYYSYDSWVGFSSIEKIIYRTLDDVMNKKISLYSIFFKERLGKFPKKKVELWNYLDIWCGAGKHLKILEKYWWAAYGFEIGGKDYSGKIKFDMHIKNIDWGAIKFDFISLWAVFEHLLDPEWYIDTINHILKDTWELHIFLPNNNSLYAKIFWSFRYNRDIPRHIFNYNPKSLKLLFAQKCFKVESINHLSAWWFITSLYQYIKYKFWIKITLLNNIYFHMLFYPIDWMVNKLWLGDNIHLTITKVVAKN
jgi:hypothetical protein